MFEDWAEDDLAYDGSSRPQERELTPRERDILCRILGDIIFQIKRTAVILDNQMIVTPEHLDGLMFVDRQGGIRMDLHEIDKIVQMRYALDPRED